MHASTHTHTHITQEHTHKHAYPHAHTRTHTQVTHEHTHTRTSAHTRNARTHLKNITHACTHARARTHTHTQHTQHTQTYMDIYTSSDHSSILWEISSLVNRWMIKLNLQLAQKKIEIVLITNRKQAEFIRVGENEITSQMFIRYLVVIVDARLNFKQ